MLGFELRAVALLARLERLGWLDDWRCAYGCSDITGGLVTLQRFAALGLCMEPRRNGIDELGWWTVPITTLGALVATLAGPPRVTLRAGR